MAGEPILIVDDTPVNLKLTRILLVNEGYSVLTAASAEEALELLRSYHPRLILADIQLPGIDGLEMTRRIKLDERTRDIAVVALTAFAMKGDEQKAVDAGCDGYITKPIDTRALGGRIRQLLEQRAAAQTAAVELPPEHEALPAAEMRRCAAVSFTKGQERARGCFWTSTRHSSQRCGPRGTPMGGNRGAAGLFRSHAWPMRCRHRCWSGRSHFPIARVAHQSAAGLQHAAGSSRYSHPGRDRSGTRRKVRRYCGIARA
jgi:CheY-like chemotaxis protein